MQGGEKFKSNTDSTITERNKKPETGPKISSCLLSPHVLIISLTSAVCLVWFTKTKQQNLLLMWTFYGPVLDFTVTQPLSTLSVKRQGWVDQRIDYWTGLSGTGLRGQGSTVPEPLFEVTVDIKSNDHRGRRKT